MEKERKTKEMKYEFIKSNKSPITFDDCELGDIFRYNSHLYIKIEDSMLIDGTQINAICLEDDADAEFYPLDTPIELYKGTVRFEEDSFVTQKGL